MNTTDVLLGITGSLILAFAALLWWLLKDHFRRNEKEHDEIRVEAKGLEKAVSGVAKRIDHVILHHEGMPPYKDE